MQKGTLTLWADGEVNMKEVHPGIVELRFAPEYKGQDVFIIVIKGGEEDVEIERDGDLSRTDIPRV